MESAAMVERAEMVGEAFEVKAHAWVDAMTAATAASSHPSWERPHMQGVLLEVRDDRAKPGARVLRIAATNGHWLCRIELRGGLWSDTGNAWRCKVPVKVVSEIAKWVKTYAGKPKEARSVSVRVAEGVLSVSVDGWHQGWAVEPGGDFPPTDRVIPERIGGKGALPSEVRGVDVDYMGDALGVARKMLAHSGERYGVKIDCRGGKLDMIGITLRTDAVDVTCVVMPMRLS